MNNTPCGAVVAIAVAAALGASAPPSYAAPTMAGPVKQLPTVYRFTIGDAQVAAFSDCTVPIDLHKTLSGITLAEIDALLAANFQSNPMDTSINVFLIQRAGRTVLVDAGLGSPPGPSHCGRMFDSLASIGVRRDQISDVVITHFHLDHIGGLSRNGELVFPNATIHVSKPELDSYVNPPSGQDSRARDMTALVMSIFKPYLDAGRVKTFEQSGEILSGLSAKILPGHTAGSTIFKLTSGAEGLVFIGDYNPVALVGFHHPDVTFVTDQERTKARAIRKEMLEDLARTGSLVAAPHLAFPGIGHVGVDGNAYRWFPIDYSNRDPDLPTAKF